MLYNRKVEICNLQNKHWSPICGRLLIIKHVEISINVHLYVIGWKNLQKLCFHTLSETETEYRNCLIQYRGWSVWGDMIQQTFKPTALNFKRLPCGSEWVFCRLTLFDSPASHLFWHMNGTEGLWDYRATRQTRCLWEDSTSTPDTMRFCVYRHLNRDCALSRYDRHENSEISSILHLSVCGSKQLTATPT